MPRHDLPPPVTVWTLRSGARVFDIATVSAREAIDRARALAGSAVMIVGLRTARRRRRDPAPPIVAPRPGLRRLDCARTTILRDAVPRYVAGEPIAAIARELNVPRETLRDWLRST